MKIIMILFVMFFFLSACSEIVEEKPYEAIFLNESSEDVILVWKQSHGSNGYTDTDSMMIDSGDSAYCKPAENWPLINEQGLRWSPKESLYDVSLKFYPGTDSSKCLYFEGDEFLPNDIRNFKSYENIGECDFCVVRAQVPPDGMLYRITENLLKQAGECR